MFTLRRKDERSAGKTGWEAGCTVDAMVEVERVVGERQARESVNETLRVVFARVKLGN